MHIRPILCMGAALVAAPAFAAAPGKPAAKTASAPAAASTEAPQEVQHAMLYLKVLISALQAKELNQEVKGALVGCLYNNTLATISQSMDKLIADNPDKISRDDPNQLLRALAAVCGYKAEPSPSTPAEKPAGR